jgi:hypothetical protein
MGLAKAGQLATVTAETEGARDRLGVNSPEPQLRP